MRLRGCGSKRLAIVTSAIFPVHEVAEPVENFGDPERDATEEKLPPAAFHAKSRRGICAAHGEREDDAIGDDESQDLPLRGNGKDHVNIHHFISGWAVVPRVEDKTGKGSNTEHEGS